MLHEIGAITGEANTDRLNELPAAVLMGWKDYIDIINGKSTASDARTWFKPEQAINLLRERFK